MDDNTIIRLIRDGKTEAYSRLVQKYHRNLLAFIYMLVRDPDLTEDIGQEVFLSVYKSLSKFDPDMGTPFAAWLYIIARNRCVSHLRSSRGARTLIIDDYQQLHGVEDSVEEKMIRHEELQALDASLEELPEPFRTTIIKSLEGATLHEIACEYGIPLSTVKSRLFRAKEKIKQMMNIYLGGVGHERRI
ncbi:MAG: sigma-70 family RNA polymerase sigma factor [Deltaproteobacteria bacterium]|nr:sigma-70 family RNA polymerase sigma factor [Deltaproteobacteria bacterium]